MPRRWLELICDTFRARLGDVDACHRIGASYATGDDGGWPVVPQTARRWYARGARRGSAECQYDLAFMLLLGEGGPPDPAAAIALLEQSAAQGWCDAIRLLADLFATGAYGVAADPARAASWSHALADHLASHPEDRRRHER